MSIGAIILKIASRCNLNCSYCYIYNHEDTSYLRTPKTISDETFDLVLKRINEYCESIGPQASMLLNFHGGEPTLVGPSRFDELASRARSQLGSRLLALAMQTNATLLDQEWLNVLKKHDVHVGISLDGPADVHDLVRVDHSGNGSYQETLRGIRCLQEAGCAAKVLCVVNPGQDGAHIYRHFRSLGIESIDFLLPDVSHDNKERFYGGLGSTPVADFLIAAFDEWYAENDPKVRVRLFWDILTVMLGGDAVSDAFGNQLMGYLIVDTDGSIEALDALRVCDEGIAKSGLNVSSHGFNQLDEGLPIVHQAVHTGFPLASACQQCVELNICGGGYLPHRYSRENGFTNPSVWCADILKMLAHVRSHASPELSLVGLDE